ncbi:thioredoxin fold domain-containing protein [Amphritea sp.]|uniref:thioredoxin family protein n=1 Tax=Amphritea sp. TaxID=1872502 RepID=UPI0025C35E88|nr:thioredoxin fold domain-containing protein [Amphritea sp.]
MPVISCRRCLLILIMLFQSLSVLAEHKMMVLEQGVQIPQPDWFKESFLDLGEDIEEAADAQRNLVLYFHQAGCPYCYNLITQVFRDPVVHARMQQSYDLIALDLWGDRSITLPDGSELTEKEFAVKLRVQYTPTLIFLNTDGSPQLRIDGYRPVDTFLKQLDQLQAKALPLASPADEVGAKTLDIPIGKPVAIQFVSDDCDHCLEFDVDILERPDTQKLLNNFTYITIDLGSNPQIILPDGTRLSARQWASKLGLSYFPSWLLLDAQGIEQLRIDAYVRAFHFNSALEYVSEGEYLREPEFQRFINERGDRLRAKGLKLEILE